MADEHAMRLGAETGTFAQLTTNADLSKSGCQSLPIKVPSLSAPYFIGQRALTPSAIRTMQDPPPDGSHVEVRIAFAY